MINTLLTWRNIESRKAKLLKVARNDAIKAYLETPLPSRNTPIEEVEFLSLDFETTGLDAKHEAILSIGYTHVRGGRIVLKNSKHMVIRINCPLGDKSVTIHQITHDRMEAGKPLYQALETLIQQMPGKVLLVHYLPIEKSFLNNAISQVFGCELPILWVDTMELENKRLVSTYRPTDANRLRLANLRKSYQLPSYAGHNALGDAIATAELFLAQMEHREKATLLKDVLTR